MKIVYTESGQRALEEFKENQVADLEKYISSKKYVFGDDMIEITAADIKQSSERRRSAPLWRRKMPYTSSLLVVYVFIGLAMAFTGLFYDELVRLMENNRTQFFFIVAGMGTSFLGFAGLIWLRLRFGLEEPSHDLEELRAQQYALSDRTTTLAKRPR